ncbi:hypothetical protein AYI70_g1417 [Smittium culicis]|uniref:Uncharacterized protein n=1 Tax=Smittium culicis TaxID=133412 RepID=A0A1R1YCQ1_9FUNG|nr:hypothetical protein AYI70_g1417 [Smittium culicis]
MPRTSQASMILSNKSLNEHAEGADLGQTEKRAHEFCGFNVFNLAEGEGIWEFRKSSRGFGGGEEVVLRNGAFDEVEDVAVDLRAQEVAFGRHLLLLAVRQHQPGQTRWEEEGEHWDELAYRKQQKGERNDFLEVGLIAHHLNKCILFQSVYKTCTKSTDKREVVATDYVLARLEGGPDRLGAFMLAIDLFQSSLVELQVIHQQLDLAHAPRIRTRIQARIKLLQLRLLKLRQTRRRVRHFKRSHLNRTAAQYQVVVCGYRRWQCAHGHTPRKGRNPCSASS